MKTSISTDLIKEMIEYIEHKETNVDYGYWAKAPTLESLIERDMLPKLYNKLKAIINE